MPSSPAPSPAYDPAGLARDASLSAAKVAQATAAHAHTPGACQENAVVALEETLQQIKRIQALYHLPSLPELNLLLERTKAMGENTAATGLT